MRRWIGWRGSGQTLEGGGDSQPVLEHENQTAVLLKGLLGHEVSSDWDNGWRPQGLMRLSETVLRNVHAVFDYASTLDSATVSHHLCWDKVLTLRFLGLVTLSST